MLPLRRAQGITILHHARGACSDAAMFVQRLNAASGEMEWAVVQQPGAAGDGAASAAEEDASMDLVAASSYLDMVTDRRRNRAYRLALRRAVRELAARRQPAAADPVSVAHWGLPL